MRIDQFTVATDTGKTQTLKQYAGQVLLIVNVASKCGLTPQYQALESLYRGGKDRGLEVLAFPCNQFGGRNQVPTKRSETSAPLSTTSHSRSSARSTSTGRWQIPCMFICAPRHRATSVRRTAHFMTT